jgi:N-acylneuraminate cytidylyltransferase
VWERDDKGVLNSMNYDWRSRKRRQEIRERYVENGSFYLFRPDMLRAGNNRLGGRIGTFVMDEFKRFQIDEEADIDLCESILTHYAIKKGMDFGQ